MKSATYPLAIPEALLEEVRETSVSTGLSVADAMRQSMRFGLPQLVIVSQPLRVANKLDVEVLMGSSQPTQRPAKPHAVILARRASDLMPLP